MLTEVQELQQKAVDGLVALLDDPSGKRELTFKAPTGSGKTHMMAQVMDELVGRHDDLVFVVSALSKANLASQNFDSFETLVADGTCQNLLPYLISSEGTSEESLLIPETGYNVYVLPRDLNREKGKLHESGAIRTFFANMGKFHKKRIVLIRDESHLATNNLNQYGEYFERIVNFSATPKLARGQEPDIEITDEAASAAHLIKSVIYHDDYAESNPDASLCEALDRITELKEIYPSKLGMTACLIIQVSNKGKVEDEWPRIKRLLETRYRDLKYMYVVTKNKGFDTIAKDKAGSYSETNDETMRKVSPAEWKDWAKSPTSMIDVIIFKLSITEGWDIPRASLLYQVRNTISERLDKQVVGRVRRNPRLVDFDKLDAEAQYLCSTAEVWGVRPKEDNQVEVKRAVPASDIELLTTRLRDFDEVADISIDDIVQSQHRTHDNVSIFERFRQVQRVSDDIRAEYRKYVDDADKFFGFTSALSRIQQKMHETAVDYSKSMVIAEDETGAPIRVTFPAISYFTVRKNCDAIIDDWLWVRSDGNTKMSFDSESEAEWAQHLNNMRSGRIAQASDGSGRFLVGKNYPYGSELCFEYYHYGLHKSYPDFVVKDVHGQIHIFESKSMNVATASGVDDATYDAKISLLEDCYREASKLTGYWFYIPIKVGSRWDIYWFHDGERNIISIDALKSKIGGVS